MNSQTFAEYVDAYVDGEMAPDQQLAFEIQARACGECETRERQVRAVKAAVRRTVSEVSAPEALRARMRRRAKVVSQRRWLRPVGVTVCAAAAVALVAGLGGLWSPFVEGVPTAQAMKPLLKDVVAAHASDLPADVRAEQPTGISDYFRGKVRFPVYPARFSTSKAKLLGGRLMHVRDRRAAALFYSVGGRRLTVVAFEPRPAAGRVFFREKQKGSGVRLFQVGGYTVPVQRHDGVIYAFTGDFDRRAMLRLVRSARLQTIPF